jgi:integrase
MLTDLAIRNAKPRSAPYKLADGQGLYVVVTRKSKLWRLDYRYGGRRKTLSLGAYPLISLTRARMARDDAKRALLGGHDPASIKQARRLQQQVESGSTFEAVAREWAARNQNRCTAAHMATSLGRLERDVFPLLGSRPITDVRPADLLTVLRKVEDRGAIETAHRELQVCSQVFRYAIVTDRADRNPATELKGALMPRKPQHRAALIEHRDFGQLLRVIDSYPGHFVTRCAFRMLPHVFVRPGELRHAEWSEFDVEQRLWRIPAHKMKCRVEHVVPLSNQVLEILEELRPFTGSGRYLFPAVGSRKRPMSNATLLAALRRSGYSKQEMTAHGFRSIASTLLNEYGWHSDAIERQLAHRERNHVRAAYNRAGHLALRARMMQWWSDAIDALRAGQDPKPPHRTENFNSFYNSNLAVIAPQISA